MTQFPNLHTCPVIAVDTETYGVDRFAKMFGFSVSTPDYQSWYYDVRRDPNSLDWLQSVLDTVPKIVNHNVSFDVRVIHNMGLRTDAKKWECTMVRACLINEHLNDYSLEGCAKFAKLDVNKDHDIYEELSKIFGGSPTRTAQIKNFPKCPFDVMEKYAKLDVIVAMKLWQWQEKEIERQDLFKIWSLEKRLTPFVISQEEHGIRVDVERAHRVSNDLEKQYTKLLKEINDEVGFDCNINSSDQLYKAFGVRAIKSDGTFMNQSDVGAMLSSIKSGESPKEYMNGFKYVARDGTVLPKTAGGKCSITADQLKVMKDPIARKIWKTKKLMKAKSTFVDGHILGNIIHDRVYPNINQNRGDNGDGMEGTKTGRLSYSKPAMQQIPSRDKEMASIIRPIFLPDENQGWTYGDLDQHEYRVFAHFANSPVMINKYRENPDLDLHQAVADLTGLPRSANPETGGANAKQINLGLVFCMGAGHLCQVMGLPFTMAKAKFDGVEREYAVAGEEGKAILELYHKMVPGVREVARQATSIAKERGYVRTIMGRHLRFPGGKETHKASGLIYQGSAADFNKLNICLICEYLESECPDGHLLLNIHDEYNISLPHENSEKHVKEIKHLVEYKPMLRVPIRTDFSMLAENWYLANVADHLTDGWSCTLNDLRI